MHLATRRTVWTAVAALVVLGPVALYAWRAEGRPLSTVLVVAGLLGLVTMALTIVAPARLRSLTRTFGIDRIIRAHRLLGVVAIVAVLVHLATVVVRSPRLLNPFAASTAVQWGWLATVCMVGVGLVAWRGRRSGRRYEVWARMHVLLAAAAIVLAAMHVFFLGDLLSDPVLRVVLSALALGFLALMFLRWVWRPLFSRHGAYVVYGVRPEGPSTATLVLAPVHLQRGMRFHAGQFVWLRLRRSVLGTEEHPFTIASSAEVTGRLELTIRGSGDFSTTLASLPPGSKVWLDGPHGSFTAAPEAAGLVLVAGGVGITPMMSMLRTLADQADPRPVHMIVAQRPDEPLFEPELASLARRLDLHVTRTAGRRVDAALLDDAVPGRGRRHLDWFVCGSPSLLAGSLAAIEQLGVPAEAVHSEQFGWSGPIPVQGSRRPVQSR
ncbi:ferredoxin reductase family protein [Actinomycetospora sp. OC33-EN08]|uniref:Ferredoxin reductase family protein n=1 Tax=Actinomycetospora aurantiaca TaxID=3129233 RepID=A0ABU8MPX7_9PSEU